MKCKYCNKEMEDEYSFCPHCGKEVIKDKVEYCANCNTEFTDEQMFCQNCGTRRTTAISKPNVQSVKNEEQDEVVETSEPIETIDPVEESIQEIDTIDQEKSIEEVTKENTDIIPENVVAGMQWENSTTDTKKNHTNYFRNPIIWTVSIALLLVSTLLGMYVSEKYSNSASSSKTERKSKDSEKENKTSEEIDNADIEDFKISKEVTLFQQQSNINTGGYVCYYDDTMYVATIKGVIAYNNDFEKEEVIIKDNVTYIYVDGTYLYYTDIDDTYYRMNLKTEEKEELIKNVFYPQHVDGIVYYQSDGDNETLHSYNLETKEDVKLNDVVTYQTFIDKEKNSIYYVMEQGEESGIHRMDLDGQNDEVIISGEISTMNYDGTNLYYYHDSTIKSYDVVTKEHNDIKKESVTELLYVNDEVVNWDTYYNKITLVDEEKDIFDKRVYYTQMLGEYIVCWIPDGKNCSVYILDTDGNCAFLVKDYTLSNDYDDWDDSYDDWDDGFDDYEDNEGMYDF